MENENQNTLSEKNSKMLPFIYMVLTIIGAFLIMGWDFIYVLSGYQLLAYWENIWFIFTGIFQILSLISMLLLLIVSIWGWAYAAGKAKELKIGSWGLKTIAEFMFIVFCATAILVAVFSGVASGITFGIITFGSLLYFLFILAAVIVYLVLWKKGTIEKEGFFALPKKEKKEEGNGDAIEVSLEEPKPEEEKTEEQNIDENEKQEENKTENEDENQNEPKEEQKDEKK